MKVKVKHIVDVYPEWLNDLAGAIVVASKAVYPSEIEEMMAINAIIEPEIHMAINDAFKAGLSVATEYTPIKPIM